MNTESNGTRGSSSWSSRAVAGNGCGSAMRRQQQTPRRGPPTPLSTSVVEKLSEKGYEQHSERWIWEVKGGQNGPKSAVSVVRKATPQAPPTLFGQSQKKNSRKFASRIVRRSPS